MLIIPAIDLQKSDVVRLYQGKFEKVTSYQKKPEELIREFIVKGVERIHVICLLGAKDGRIAPEDVLTLQTMVKARDTFAMRPCRMQLGGGIRRYEEIETFFGLGIDYLIISTAILLPLVMECGFSTGDVKNFYQRGGKKFEAERELPQFDLTDRMDPDTRKKIIIGIDVYKDSVALSGWQVIVPVQPSYLINKLSEKGFEQFILTDVSRDGTMKGPDVSSLEYVFERIRDNGRSKNFMVAGGISTLKDLENIRESRLPVSGVVIGKAIYEGGLDLKQAVSDFQKV